MQIVINIPNSTFTDLKKKQNRTEVDVAVLNGTPLPKGHGRLIDENQIDWLTESDGSKITFDKRIKNTSPTIIEADEEG